MSRPFKRRRVQSWLSGKRSLSRLLLLRESDRDDLVWQARRLLDSGAIDDAARLFDLARTLWPSSSSSTLGLAACRQLSGRLAEAETLYGEALESVPDAPYALAGRAECRLLMQRNEEARGDLARARDAQPPADLLGRIDALDALASDNGPPADRPSAMPGSNDGP